MEVKIAEINAKVEEKIRVRESKVQVMSCVKGWMLKGEVKVYIVMYAKVLGKALGWLQS